MSFQKYLDVVSGDFKKAIKVEWLNPNETVAFEFTNSLYDINVDLNVNYQNGSRRTCTLTLNNDRNQFPINFNNIWFGQKFKLWMGIYIDNETPYYFPQGVFYISNPNEVYQPLTKVIKINGVDKWAFLDGTLHGKLSGTYQTNIGNDLLEATRELLRLPKSIPTTEITSKTISYYFEVTNGNYRFEYDEENKKFVANVRKKNAAAEIMLEAKRDMQVSFGYRYACDESNSFSLKVNDEDIEITEFYDKTATKFFSGFIPSGKTIKFKYYMNSNFCNECEFFNMCIGDVSGVVDPVSPIISPYFLTKTSYVPTTDTTKVSGKTYYEYDKNNGIYTEYTGNSVEGKYVKEYVKKCPYTAKVERGKTYADILLEYATILCAHIYYDANGRLTIEPMIDESDDITDTNKETVWHFTVEEKQLLGLNTTYNFDKVHNDIIVLGNIANGYQFKARVQNRNLLSDTCIQKIGLKTKEPLEDNQYYSDDQCKELAIYYAKIDTILQKSGDISSAPLYHLDVNKIVSLSTPNNNMSKELFLITGFTLNSSNSMSVNVTSVNVLNDFGVVEADIYE